MQSKYFEDFERGETVTTSARTITEADQVNFAGLSGNFHPIHLDRERMERSEYGGRLVYGYLVLSVMAGLVIQTGIVEEVVAHYGIDELRFTAPVMIGDTVHGELTVVDLEDRDDASGVVVLEERTMNQDDETVLVAETRRVFRKRDGRGE